MAISLMSNRTTKDKKIMSSVEKTTKKYLFFLFVIIGVTFQFIAPAAISWKKNLSSSSSSLSSAYNDLPTTISGISNYMTTKYNVKEEVSDYEIIKDDVIKIKDDDNGVKIDNDGDVDDIDNDNNNEMKDRVVVVEETSINGRENQTQSPTQTKKQKQKLDEQQKQQQQQRQRERYASQILFSNDGIYNPIKAEQNENDQLLHVYNITVPLPIPTIYRSSTNIPKWMKEYFDWHRKQTSMLNETNWNSAGMYLKNTKETSQQQDTNHTNTNTNSESSEEAEGPRFLIIRCLNTDRCGGLSDRLKPIVAYIAVAAHTKRILMIRWERPYPLEEFLVPNEINWTVPSYMLEEFNQYIGSIQEQKRSNSNTVSRIFLGGQQINRSLRNSPATVVESKIQLNDGGATFYVCVVETMFGKQDDIELNTTIAYRQCGDLRFGNGDAQHKANELYRTIYHDLFRSIFTPSPNVQQLITKRMIDSGLVAGQFIGAHTRSSYGKAEFDRVGVETIVQSTKAQIRCAARMRPGYPVYFSGDSSTVLNVARQESKLLYLHKNITIITPPSPITEKKNNSNNATTTTKEEEQEEVEGKSPLHIEFDKGSVHEFYPVFVDLLVMGQSMCQLYGIGGFGTFASLLSYNASCFYSTAKCDGGESYYLPKDKCCMHDMYYKHKKCIGCWHRTIGENSTR